MKPNGNSEFQVVTLLFNEINFLSAYGPKSEHIQ